MSEAGSEVGDSSGGDHVDRPNESPGNFHYGQDLADFAPRSSTFGLRFGRISTGVLAVIGGVVLGLSACGPRTPNEVVRNSPWPSGVDVESDCPVDRFGYAEERCANLYNSRVSDPDKHLKSLELAEEGTPPAGLAAFNRPEKYDYRAADRVRSVTVVAGDLGL